MYGGIGDAVLAVVRFSIVAGVLPIALVVAVVMALAGSGWWVLAPIGVGLAVGGVLALRVS